MILVHDTSSYCALQLYGGHLDSFNGCHLTERTRNSIANDPAKENNSKNIQSRVMVLVHDTFSHCALEVYEVSTK